MADGIIQIPADSTGKKLDTTELTVGANTVERERLVISGAGATELADVRVTTPSSADFGLVIRGAMNSTTVTLGSVGILSGSTAAGLGTVISTAAGSAAIDPRQATIVAATSGAGLGTIISTGVGGAALDPRARTWALSSAETVAIVGTASSGVLGTVLSATGLTGAAIDPRQVTVVGGTSGAYMSVLNATAQGAATIDPRQATIVAATSGAGLGTILSTAVGAAAIDPRLVILQAGTTALVGAVAFATVSNNVSLWSSSGVNIGASTVLPSSDAMALFVRPVMGSTATTLGSVALLAGTSGNTVGNVTVSTGTVALYSSTGGAIAVSTQTLSTDAMGFAVRVAAATTATTIGAVVVSTAAGGLRDFADSTTVYNQLYYWTTGIVAAAAATMQSLNLTKNLSSGSSGTSFNVAAGKIFRIDHIEGSIRVSSGTDLYADFAIRAVTTTGGATGANFPVFYHRINANAESTNALAAGGGGNSFNMNGLSIDLPSSASYGVSITSNSTASQECTFAFGGKEFTI